jgi:hypothetical protein
MLACDGLSGPKSPTIEEGKLNKQGAVAERSTVMEARTTVTLDIFSGMPNPSWELGEDEAQELLSSTASLKEQTAAKPSGVAGMLGYRGFFVSRPPTSPHGSLGLYVHEGLIDRGQRELNVMDAQRRTERLLLESGRKHLGPELTTYLEELIKAKPAGPIKYPVPKAARCPTCAAADAPPYNPGKWNVPSVQPYNNCYNYANDQITNTLAQPGKAHGVPITALNCGGVQPSAQADGLAPAANFSSALGPGKGWYVALVIWPGMDYHWYRQDNVGCWSHKPGGTAARNTDDSGNPITDPQTCNRGPYTVFCTYMITTRGVVIR